jgi:hypothetical protein
VGNEFVMLDRNKRTVNKKKLKNGERHAIVNKVEEATQLEDLTNELLERSILPPKQLNWSLKMSVCSFHGMC